MPPNFGQRFHTTWKQSRTEISEQMNYYTLKQSIVIGLFKSCDEFQPIIVHYLFQTRQSSYLKLKYLFEIASWVPGTPQTRNPLLPPHFWSNMDVTYLSAMVGQNSKSATLFVRKFGFVLKITLMQRADFLLIEFYQAVKSPPPHWPQSIKTLFFALDGSHKNSF